jgi:hypothetical protein
VGRSTGRTARQKGIDLVEVHGAQVARILTRFDVVGADERMTGVSSRSAPGSF